jgi:hypothetical protein
MIEDSPALTIGQLARRILDANACGACEERDGEQGYGNEGRNDGLGEVAHARLAKEKGEPE